MGEIEDKWEKRYQGGDLLWDPGKPQQCFVDLVGRGLVSGKVVDIGCGAGSLVNYLAQNGRDVCGIDASPTAITIARKRLRAMRQSFKVMNALKFVEHAGFRGLFDSAVDTGVFHQFPAALSYVYAYNVASILRPHGRYYGLMFSEKAPAFPTPLPRRLTEGEIAAVFCSDLGFEIESMEDAEFENRDGSRIPSRLVVARKISSF